MRKCSQCHFIHTRRTILCTTYYLRYSKFTSKMYLSKFIVVLSNMWQHVAARHPFVVVEYLESGARALVTTKTQYCVCFPLSARTLRHHRHFFLSLLNILLYTAILNTKLHTAASSLLSMFKKYIVNQF